MEGGPINAKMQWCSLKEQLVSWAKKLSKRNYIFGSSQTQTSMKTIGRKTIQ